MRLTDLLFRMLLVLALIGSSLPISASEAVCVMPNRVVVPMATCGMPCCVRPQAASRSCAAPRAAAKPTCCRGAGERGVSSPPSAHLGKAACRCEVRPTATLRPMSGPVAERSAVVVLHPAALSDAPTPVVVALTPAPEPGIVGSDSGPPPESFPCDSSGRSPPARPVSSEA